MVARGIPEHVCAGGLSPPRCLSSVMSVREVPVILLIIVRPRVTSFNLYFTAYSHTRWPLFNNMRAPFASAVTTAYEHMMVGDFYYRTRTTVYTRMV